MTIEFPLASFLRFVPKRAIVAWLSLAKLCTGESPTMIGLDGDHYEAGLSRPQEAGQGAFVSTGFAVIENGDSGLAAKIVKPGGVVVELLHQERIVDGAKHSQEIAEICSIRGARRGAAFDDCWQLPQRLLRWRFVRREIFKRGMRKLPAAAAGIEIG